VRRAHEAAALWTSSNGSEARFLLGTDPPEGVELWEWEIAPGEDFDGGAHPVGTRELLTVRAGCLGLALDGRVTELGQGDSVLFEATVPHTYRGLGDTTTSFTMVVLISDLSGLGPMDPAAHRAHDGTEDAQLAGSDA
jgi:quercetin dioxygenase-like cupin family protein